MISSCGLVLRPRREWLFDSGIIIIYSNIAVEMCRLLRYVAELPLMLGRLRILCENAGLPFVSSPLDRKWMYPTAIGALFLSVCLRVAALVFHNAHNLFHLVSLGVFFAGIAAGPVALFVADKRIARTIRKLEGLTVSHPVSSGPNSAKFLLFLIVPRHNREHLIGDLEEEYATIILPDYGERKAKFWYWWKVITCIAPSAWAWVKRILTVALLLRHGH